MNAKQLLRSIGATICLIGCGGGTMGTGVRKYSDKTEIEVKEPGLFDFETHAARCSIELPDQSEIRMRLMPIVGSVRGERISETSCRATILPQRSSLVFVITREDRSFVQSTFEIQHSDPKAGWIHEGGGAGIVDPTDNEATKFEFAAHRLIPGRLYRILVSEHVGPQVSFEFTIGNTLNK